MHELGLCESIVDAVALRAGERRVAKVKVRVGCLQHVHPEAFEQSFAIAALGSVAEGAAAELARTPVCHHCRSCGSTFEAGEFEPLCPHCDGVHVEVTGGDELVLESIEYRVANTGS